jgi:hypothetical protein
MGMFGAMTFVDLHPQHSLDAWISLGFFCALDATAWIFVFRQRRHREDLWESAKRNLEYRDQLGELKELHANEMRRLEDGHRFELSRCAEIRDGYAAEKREALGRVADVEAQLAMFSPLQLEVLHLSGDLLEFLAAMPQPRALDHAGSSEEITTTMLQFQEWSQKILYRYNSEFAAKVRQLENSIGQANPSFAAYLTRFNVNGSMRPNDVKELSDTLWEVARKLGEEKHLSEEDRIFGRPLRSEGL